MYRRRKPELSSHWRRAAVLCTGDAKGTPGLKGEMLARPLGPSTEQLGTLIHRLAERIPRLAAYNVSAFNHALRFAYGLNRSETTLTSF